MKTISLAAALAATLIGGQALAADAPDSAGFRIESEDQFVRDYGDRVERVAPGVYQVVEGPLAGKTLAMGEAGLAYELAALRARVPTSLRERALIKARIKRLEGVRTRYSKLHALQARDATKASTSSSLPCQYYNPRTNTTIFYNAVAYVQATAEYYMSNGGGGLNYYYARASASASGTVVKPGNVPFASGVVSVYALARNNHNGTLVQQFNYGPSVSAGTGYVYSGPDFSHDLDATAAVEGDGDCYGFVSISDALQ
ncbi:MAG: hypothetical protein ACOY82_07065 [Pseudomonadota bacterium]